MSRIMALHVPHVLSCGAVYLLHWEVALSSMQGSISTREYEIKKKHIIGYRNCIIKTPESEFKKMIKF